MRIRKRMWMREGGRIRRRKERIRVREDDNSSDEY